MVESGTVTIYRRHYFKLISEPRGLSCYNFLSIARVVCATMSTYVWWVLHRKFFVFFFFNTTSLVSIIMKWGNKHFLAKVTLIIVIAHTEVVHRIDVIRCNDKSKIDATQRARIVLESWTWFQCLPHSQIITFHTVFPSSFSVWKVSGKNATLWRLSDIALTSLTYRKENACHWHLKGKPRVTSDGYIAWNGTKETDKKSPLEEWSEKIMKIRG